MKKILLSLVAAVTLSLSSFGQAPEGFKYQAVVRDAGNTILNNQVVGLRMTIQQGSIGGITVYSETFAPTTNMYGLVNLEVGNGTVISGTFANIDWSAGPYFMETAVDITGGTNYSVMGTSQLMSVPYALYAKTSGNGQGPAGVDGINGTNGTNGIDGTDGAVGAQGPIGLTGPAGNTGATGPMGPQGPAGNDGAIGATGPLGPQGPAGNDGATGPQGPVGPTGAEGQGGVTTAGSGINVTGTGTIANPYVISSRTYTIGLWPELGGYVFWVSADGKHGLVAETQNQFSTSWYEVQNLISNPANHSVNGRKFRDWRIPTKYELNEMYLARLAIGGFADNEFWSSTVDNASSAWRQYFLNGNQSTNLMVNSSYVRAVRAF